MSEIKKVPWGEYLTWIMDWTISDRTLRLGQSFVNRFHPSVGEPISQLFYEEDDTKAGEYIIQNYVDWEQRESK